MKLSKKEKVLFAIVSAIFFIYSITLLFPFVFTIIGSLKTNFEFLTDIWALPKQLYLSNFKFVFENFNLGTMYMNSIWITFFGTIIQLISCTTLAYVLARYQFPGRNILIAIALGIMIFPAMGTAAATYKLLKAINLLDNPIGLIILYGGALGANFLLLFSYFKGISNAYAESAMMDGAGHFTIFFKIMLPQAKGGVMSIAFLQMIGLWNDFSTPYFFMPNFKTLATGLQDLSSNARITGAYTQMFTAMFLSILPLLIIFTLFSRKIIDNTVMGGLKG